MDDQVKIHGLREVQRALRKLPKDIRKRELNKILRSGAKIIQAAAKAFAPTGQSFTRKIRGKDWDHYSGLLRDSIMIRAEKKRYLNDAAMMRIGVLTDNKKVDTAWYWRFVEFGTVHQAAQPFLVPAFESTKYIVDASMRKALLKAIDRLVKLNSVTLGGKRI